MVGLPLFTVKDCLGSENEWSPKTLEVIEEDNLVKCRK